MKNILITSISGKVPLIEVVKDSRDKFDRSIKIYGADINCNIVGKYFVDYFWLMPKISKLKLSELINYCNENCIKYIIPTRDADVIYFSKYKNELLKNKIYCFVSEYASVEICFDKLLFFRKIKNEMIVPTFENIDELEGVNSFVIKERFGAGSTNIGINLKLDQVKKFIKNFDAPIIQPFIEGEEYSIDSYLNKEGNYLGSIIRSRDIVIDGESKVTTRVINGELEVKAKEFLEKNKILGHSVLQVIKDKNGYHIIECNARFGGASTLSYTLGLESFLWFLQECNGDEVSPKISHKKLKLIRISKDIYLES